MKAWITLENGRQVYRTVNERKPVARSAFPCPLIRSDRIEPVQSMADGKFYDSLSALRATYKPSGNPQGEEYTEIGDAPMRGPKEMPRMTKQEISDLLDKSEAMISRGEVPQLEGVKDSLPSV
jgi:hypothetical protein